MPGITQYVGCKSKLKLEVYSAIQGAALGRSEEIDWDGSGYEYREPFLGGGSVFLEMVWSKRAWLNDLDSGMACLHTAAIHYPYKLLSIVKSHEKAPDKKAWNDWHDILKTRRIDPEVANPGKIIEHGFYALALPYVTFSSVQRKASYRPEKWSPTAMRNNVLKMHERYKGVDLRYGVITSRDYRELLNAKSKALIYCDPPYVKAGAGVYRQGWKTVADHEHLAKALEKCKHKWVLSYDNHPLIRTLYKGCRIDRVGASYNIRGAVKNDYELIISR